jgi:CBS domain containing-hemolysin-like protein
MASIMTPRERLVTVTEGSSIEAARDADARRTKSSACLVINDELGA